jgi:hypothetical protein
MKDTLCSEWQVTDLWEPTKIVGIEINHTSDTITISQQKYIESILCKEGMAKANPVSIPMDPNIKLQPNLDVNELNCSNSYVKLLGSLQFLANSTRPDISYAVNKLATYTTNLSLQHHNALKWMLRYIQKLLGLLTVNPRM